MFARHMAQESATPIPALRYSAPGPSIFSFSCLDFPTPHADGVAAPCALRCHPDRGAAALAAPTRDLSSMSASPRLSRTAETKT